MTTSIAPSTSAAAVVRVRVRHWHVTESDAGYLPEAEPATSTDAGSALDDLAHLLNDWAQTHDDLQDAEALYAAAVAEHYCACRQDARSAEHHAVMTAVEDGRAVCEQIGCRVFELIPCAEKDCLKYCPAPGCGTVTPATDADHRCWCCGAAYVDGDSCTWLT